MGAKSAQLHAVAFTTDGRINAPKKTAHAPERSDGDELDPISYAMAWTFWPGARPSRSRISRGMTN